MLIERFQCSPQADVMWGRLLALYRLKRMVGDVQLCGQNWAEWGAIPRNGGHSDLGTNARLLFIASVGALTRLEGQGLAQQTAVEMARRRLGAGGKAPGGVGHIRRRAGLTFEEAGELLALVKEWLAWALGEDNIGAEPDLPWQISVVCTA